MNPAQVVEAVLFASDAPLEAEEIARADESLNEDLVEEAIQELNAVYSESERAFEIRELGEGYQLLTRADFAPYLERFDTVPRPSRLSGPALETLAIIAYRQRGVSSAGVIRTLQDRGLVDVVARGEGLGRPLLYGTTQRFLEHFGFRSLEDLPRPEELPVILSERAPLEEEAPPEETSELAPEDEPAESEPGVEEVLAEPESETPDSGPNGGGNGGGHVAGEPEEIQDPEDTDRD